ncbi:(2Fe-2S) ferredoxin domain-containing protein [Maritalea mediterranea]|uniref:(2Fe-2S) ferredoxin domain-containing protein n=1 Tax=Maritalea mediterranea TaxID=2909667 RepID=A0ABS9EBU3_9HYPH|nr:(2Fe-2S) ferredoxin domain-containing protein [Maritalea mediterranea]MCF4099225.1 (2Fe-2S) ferredoxin domain-containing protein [Maritalea mediterranea]
MQFEIFLVSTNYVSNRKFAALSEALVAANHTPCAVVRLEHQTNHMFHALDRAIAEGATRIVLRPVGVPFSQSLRQWVPNAAADWLTRQPANSVEVAMAADLDEDEELLKLIANRPYRAEPIAPKIDGINGKGWDMPPAYEHHLLVCTGPRCHLRGSFGLLEPLKLAVQQAGISSKCLIASTGCLFPCNNGPALVHYPKGDWYQLNSEEDVARFVQDVLVHHRSSPLQLPFAPPQRPAAKEHASSEEADLYAD